RRSDRGIPRGWWIARIRLIDTVSGSRLFHVMRNASISETDILDQLLRRLDQILPPGWTVSVPGHRLSENTALRQRPAVLIEVAAPDGSRSLIAVEAKSRLDPKDVANAVEQARTHGFAPIVIAAPYISPRARERLIELGAGYADATGNLRVAVDRPAVLIELTGAQSSPWRDDRPLRSLKGRSAGRVVRALCDFKPPYGIRELAQRARLSAATLTRVVEFLDREAIVERTPRGPVLAVDWSALIHRWAQDYSLTASNRTANFIEPRGLTMLVERLRDWRGYCLTGSLAAAPVAPLAPTRLAVIYVPSITEAAEFLKLRPADAGANVLLAEPFDPVVFERTRQHDGLTSTALSQVAADLLTSPGRGPSEAEELLEWMARNEDAWRT
ncbi:MAG: hypothetical protein ACRDJO_02760, partial [Actinomycetota bacterium]